MYQPYCFSWIQASTLAAQTTTAIKPKLSSPVYEQLSPESTTRQNMSNNIYQKDTDGWLANTTAGHCADTKSPPGPRLSVHSTFWLPCNRSCHTPWKRKWVHFFLTLLGYIFAVAGTEVKTAPKVLMWHLFIKYVFIFLVKKIGKHKIR